MLEPSVSTGGGSHFRYHHLREQIKEVLEKLVNTYPYQPKDTVSDNIADSNDIMGIHGKPAKNIFKNWIDSITNLTQDHADMDNMKSVIKIIGTKGFGIIVCTHYAVTKTKCSTFMRNRKHLLTVLLRLKNNI